MKQFYTVRDIEDMHAAGVTQIDIHDDVVLTDVAREKAIALGMQLIPMASHALPQATQVGTPNDPIQKIKAAVVARLGTDKYNQLLDKIIPQVMSQLKK